MLNRAVGAYIFGCASTKLSEQERAFFKKVDPFGFIIFSRNIENCEQMTAFCAELRTLVGRNVPIFVDQEGGRVQRFRAPMATEWPSPLDHVRLVGEQAEKEIYARYTIIAQELRRFGITANCIPCADIARPETHPILKNRCFGFNQELVGEMALAAANGLMHGGVLPVMKHLPGQGLVNADSHKSLPYTDASFKMLKAIDFSPFRKLNHLLMGMTAHVVYGAIDRLPGTISHKVIQAIRKDIGFDGLLMSDDLSMKALKGNIHSRATAAVAAGCDLVLHCNGKLEEMREVAAAVGRFSARGAVRADKVINLQDKLANQKVDISCFKAQLTMD